MLQPWDWSVMLLSAALVTDPHLVWRLGETQDLLDPLPDAEDRGFLEIKGQDLWWGGNPSLCFSS